jgi:hypothetical protein
MRKVHTIEEYQKCIDEVKKTKQSLVVFTDLNEFEFKRRAELDMDGVKILVGERFDEIVPEKANSR